MSKSKEQIIKQEVRKKNKLKIKVDEQNATIKQQAATIDKLVVMLERNKTGFLNLVELGIVTGSYADETESIADDIHKLLATIRGL